jgi:hypothetical protein
VFKKIPAVLHDDEKPAFLTSATVPFHTEKLTYVWSLPIRRELEVKHVTPEAHAAILI